MSTAAADGLERLNLTGCDFVSTEAAYDALRATRARRRADGAAAGRPGLRILDYYGNCLSCGADGEPRKGPPAGGGAADDDDDLPLIGWVESWMPLDDPGG